VASFKIVNLKGDLFATGFCFLAQAVIKLGSSLIITRLLPPEAYGVVTVVISIVFVIEMLADIGVTVFIVRDKNAELPRYLNTAWTMRLGRAVMNSAVLFLLGPLIATHIYNTPALAAPLRVFSLWFIISGLQTMSFPIAIRRKSSRKYMYSELAATTVGTVFSLTYCYYSHDYWGMIYATLIFQLVMTVLSYQFYKELRPKLQFDWPAAKEILGFTKYTMPSSILTLALSQYDKIVFLRLFNLPLLGVYGLAGNIAGPIEALISKISQTVLYPRCAHNFREDEKTFFLKYYTDNAKLFFSIMILPALVGGAARLVITILYPARYAEAAAVLKAFMLRAALLSLASPAEDLLIAAGQPQILLVGNILRAVWMLLASLTGYYFFGFMGFTFGAASSGLPVLIYYYWLQSRKQIIIWKYELYKAIFIIAAASVAYFGSSLFLALWPDFRIRN
jgi:lipopolysaccharide exporter